MRNMTEILYEKMYLRESPEEQPTLDNQLNAQVSEENEIPSASQ